ncbi:serine hydrolase domain-containing protein [Larkinella soli]|uniref:serine hydrolase domain-containing protein n=1 Tax=Larkinella soli TaxID=1770527 RepID=UPI000FFB354B|nr:serine hydrolase domain-containing protein [Larkinella soli]
MNRFAAFLLCSCFSAAFAQKPAHPVLLEARPESVGLSSERLMRLDRVLQEYVDQKKLPGVAALIARDGRIVYHKGFGKDDIEAGTPLRRDAIFRIASQTKAITSTAVMMLFEEGKLLLDEPVSNYIPAFKNQTVLSRFNEKDTTYTTIPAKREVTIRDLLTHTSGIGYAGIGSKEANAIYAKAKIPSGIGTPNEKLSEKIPALGRLPLMHQPGERWTYGLNTDVLGYLVEVVSKQPFDEFLRSRIFDPLGMKDTFFYLPADRHSRLTALYTEDSTKAYRKILMRNGMSADYPKQKGTFFSGGAGLSSTLYDYAIFLQMMLNGGEYNGKRILSPVSVRMMTMNQTPAIPNQRFGLGFGIASDREEARIGVSEGSFSWSGYFGTVYWVDPKEKIVALIFTQKVPNSYRDLADKFRALLYQAITDSEQPLFEAGK